MTDLKQVIKGLEVRDAEVREIEEDGKKVKRHYPLTRKMREDDVLSWKEYSDEVVVVSKDGRKHHISKTDKEK